MSLAQLIQDTESTNNEKRKIAEEQLLEARNQNPSLFILACSQEFSQNNLPDLLRPKAGILIKYTLINFPVQFPAKALIYFSRMVPTNCGPVSMMIPDNKPRPTSWVLWLILMIPSETSLPMYCIWAFSVLILV